ncbi:unnamed protein product [Bursaphelenchus xylophilus]|uniref:(pine wood nematode) hypothetical protein n=1 Tax=Bursaphelenchus xylophilus TaxID=6326 RepID=A0A1I7RM94_BURXY|nr:unnamed protein product [Bursaphelenchus xylophilus]CAG9118316.1 unnamed protein product [Bursaphelenchus xylophilus]
MTASYLFWFWLSDVLGSAFGLVLNVLLVTAVLMSAKNRRIHPYSWMVFIMGLQDIAFCLLEVMIQHIVCMKHSVFLIFGHGIEQHLPRRLYPLAFFLHATLIMNSITLLPAMYQFRYQVIANDFVNLKPLIKNCVIAVTASCSVGFTVIFAIIDMNARGKQYYLDLLSEMWFDENGRSDFIYATDFQDTSTKVFIFTTVVISATCMGILIVYAYKAYAFANPNTTIISKATKVLQKQFTRSLIAQTLCVGLLANFPVGVLLYCVMLGIDGEFAGIFLMSPLSWVSAINAALTFYFMRDYRRILFGFIKRVPLGKTETYSFSRSIRSTSARF